MRAFEKLRRLTSIRDLGGDLEQHVVLDTPIGGALVFHRAVRVRASDSCGHDGRMATVSQADRRTHQSESSQDYCTAGIIRFRKEEEEVNVPGTQFSLVNGTRKGFWIELPGWVEGASSSFPTDWEEGWLDGPSSEACRRRLTWCQW